MRKFLQWMVVCFALLMAVGVGAALGVQWSGVAHGMTVSIDGETIGQSAVAAGIGGAAALVAGIVCVLVLVALASAVIIVPIALVLALIVAVIAAIVGIAPLLVPVLLVVGAYVLLSRRARRRGPDGAVRVHDAPAAAPASS